MCILMYDGYLYVSGYVGVLCIRICVYVFEYVWMPHPFLLSAAVEGVVSGVCVCVCVCARAREVVGHAVCELWRPNKT